MSRVWRNQSGDTLVEVVISIAILAAVMATAYTMGNSALRNGIDAREHTEAVYLSQQQAERLIARREVELNDPVCTSAAGTNSIFSQPATCGFNVSGGAYCLNNNLAILDATNAACTVGNPEHYQIQASSTLPTAQPPNKLMSTTINVKWQSIIGDTDAPDKLSNEQIVLKQIDDRNIPVRSCEVVGQPQCR